jgi:hypothetical protein
MRSNDIVFQKLSQNACRRAESGISINELMYGLRTHAIPMAEYVMRNSICFKESLKEIDKLIGKIIRDKIGGMALPSEIFYLDIKKGGFGLMNLFDRYESCKNRQHHSHF